MAVNSIVFGGVDSADYGIYISGEGVFDAPKRDVEMIEIPGRNGAFALDNGRFENIEVTYPAFNFEPNDYETFAQNLSDFRNALCSQKGYQRLTDSFHPDEYRVAVYREGLDVKPVKYNTASEFNIVFDCKPQRWLTSGESAVTVESGDTLTNPTLFEASPLLEVEGYGNIEFNEHIIELDNAVMGDVLLAGRKSSNLVNFYDDYSLVSLNTGDDIIVSGASFVLNPVTGAGNITILSVTDSNSDFSTTYALRDGYYYFTTSVAPFTAHKGTNTVKQNTLTVTGTNLNGAFTTILSEEMSVGAYYQQPEEGFCALLFSRVSGDEFFMHRESSHGEIKGYSTTSILGHPTYIDCDLGEAYRIESGEIISLNKYIDLGSNLPELASGSNEFTLDNTITELKVVPRWWKI